MVLKIVYVLIYLLSNLLILFAIKNRTRNGTMWYSIAHVDFFMKLRYIRK